MKFIQTTEGDLIALERIVRFGPPIEGMHSVHYLDEDGEPRVAHAQQEWVESVSSIVLPNFQPDMRALAVIYDDENAPTSLPVPIVGWRYHPVYDIVEAIPADGGANNPEGIPVLFPDGKVSAPFDAIFETVEQFLSERVRLSKRKASGK